MSSEEIGDLMMIVWRRWKSSSPVGNEGITREQYWVLRTLSEAGSLMIKDLAERIGCTPGSASVAVKRLERSGLVKRERSPDDERVVTVTLERKGEERLLRWRRAQVKALSVLFERLDPGEKRTLQDLLGKAVSVAVPSPNPEADGGGGQVRA